MCSQCKQLNKHSDIGSWVRIPFASVFSCCFVTGRPSDQLDPSLTRVESIHGLSRSKSMGQRK
jgi:hypothetical protein